MMVAVSIMPNDEYSSSIRTDGSLSPLNIRTINYMPGDAASLQFDFTSVAVV